MTASILNAIGKGFTAKQVLNRVANKFPQYADNIYAAQAAGYTANQVLRNISKNKQSNSDDDNSYLTDHEKGVKQDEINRRSEALQFLGILGAAGATASALYAYNRSNRGVKPDEILDREKNQLVIRNNQGPDTRPTSNKSLQNHQRQLDNKQRQVEFNDNEKNQESHQNQQSEQTPQNLSPDIKQKTNLPPLKLFEEKYSDVTSKIDQLIGSGNDEDRISAYMNAFHTKEAMKAEKDMRRPFKEIVKEYMEAKRGQESPDSQIKEGRQETQQPIQQELPKEVPQQQVTAEETRSPEKPIQPVMPIANQEMNQMGMQNPVAPAEQIPIKGIDKIVMTPKGPGEITHQGKEGSIVQLGNEKKSFFDKDIENAPEDLEDVVRELMSMIPENEKSTAIQGSTFVELPENPLIKSVTTMKFYDGKIAWYLNMPKQNYDEICLGTYTPKGQGKTGIAEYNPGVADSRGSAFHHLVKINPLYSKENKNKTWGYADSSYNALAAIQPILHKMSKERLDEKGNIIKPNPKKRKKQT